MEAADVFLWGTHIGVVTLMDGELLPKFQYMPDFIDSGIELSPLKMPLGADVYSFPELSRVEAFNGLPGLLADSLPDKFGNSVLDVWLAEEGKVKDDLSAIDRLCYTGKRGMGALEYSPAMVHTEDVADVLHVDALADLAARVLKFRETAKAELTPEVKQYATILKVGSSAGGARAKAIIGWNERTGEVRSGQVALPDGFGYWLMKFDGVSGNGDKDGEDSKGYGRIEYAYSLMAKAAGIQMSECMLWDGRHFMTRRFDRKGAGEKLHMQTLGALAHLDFNQPRSHSYEEAFTVVRRIVADAQALEQLFRRMVFNVLAWNCDDHVKNISFLMDKFGQWTLAPGYDLTYSYNKSSKAWTHAHQMSVNGKFSGIEESDLAVCAREANLSGRKARSVISEIKDIVRRWPDFATKVNVNEIQAEEISKLIGCR